MSQTTALPVFVKAEEFHNKTIRESITSKSTFYKLKKVPQPENSHS